MAYNKNINGSFTLTCKCGKSATFMDNHAAFVLGWRVSGNDHLCPSCMDRRNRRDYRADVKRYGKANADRGWSAVKNL